MELQALGPQLVIVKGGRRPGSEAVDVAFDGLCVTMLRAPWIDTANVHGTGCTFSAAIAAKLALGLEPLEAAFRPSVSSPGRSSAVRDGISVPATGLLDQLGAAAASSAPPDRVGSCRPTGPLRDGS